ncbi:hypothetical protein LR066_00890, partial [candidate division WOR-3 bacterium]|nr:hypothetical protein [candidate division WOR-3 bacterium]
QVVASGDDFASCNMAFKRSVLRELGGFDENFIFPCCEDTDLSLRVQRYGSMVYNRAVIVSHPPVKQSFIQFVKRVKYSCEGQYLLSIKHPHIFRHRKPLLSVIRVIGIRSFMEDLTKNRPFIRRNPLLFFIYWLALIAQRAYLAYFLLTNHIRLKNYETCQGKMTNN